ncbi:MAG: hypothetical protein MRERV_4c100 [Mycoplasmataceae bacterium RV_VA103A]|nr:MAG: hypothetical protein MRERV_11c055 [Mycoplasmataceae bacterium RV_VA103A]KLL05189.1 MAG: hypothetical protein MRERV_4c100 [Mycoplasmataceae bacterium RV_VA103A]
MLKVNNSLKKGFDSHGRSWEEVDAIVKKMRQPDYHQKSRGLMPDATPTDRAKYEIQQNILRYKRENDISNQDLKKMLAIKTKRRLECLLFAHIENFSLDELFSYAEKLSIPLQIINEEEIPVAITKKNISLVRKSNGRPRKHL